MSDQGVRKGDHFDAGILAIEVLRVARNGSWADIRVRQERSAVATWTKRQPMPFPSYWRRRTP